MELLPHVRRIRERIMATEDTVCLERARRVTEAFRQHDGAPRVLVRAHAFAHVLDNMTLDLDSNPVFAGNTSARVRAWMLVPEHGFRAARQVLHEHTSLTGILDGAIPADLKRFWEARSVGGACDPGHLAVDYATVVDRGLQSLVADLESLAGHGTTEQQAYRHAMRITLKAVIRWAARYAAAADAAAVREPDLVVAACHRRVAAACRRVPARPARSLFEGLQAIALVHLALALEGHGMSISIGLPDRVLSRFDAPGLRDTDAPALVAAFLLKINANSVFGRGSKTQAITVGGADAHGLDCSNGVTQCFLAAADIARVGDPHVFLRWHKGLAPPVRQQAADLLSAGLSMPLLIHDEPTVAGFLRNGVSADDAWSYCVIGCNELGIPGLSCESASARAGTIQHLEILTRVLQEHPAPDTLASTDDVINLMQSALRAQLRRSREHYVRAAARRAAQSPVPFTTALMQDCGAAGADLTQSMHYRLPGLYERGVSNATNALAAIQCLVFESRTLRLSDLIAAMRADFASGAVRERLAQAPKWGNDDPRADRWALKLLDMRDRVLREIDAEFGHRGHSVCHVVRSLHHMDGLRIDASPDGRPAGAPVGDSVGADLGTARSGPTALLNSVARIDAARFYAGGYNLNLTLDRNGSTPERLLALAEAFFGQGGQELQVNCLNADQLREAQRCPAEHGDLLVRFAGLSARFVDLSPVEQNEIIARAANCGRPG